jgi:hypothetical protein
MNKMGFDARWINVTIICVELLSSVRVNG